MIYVNENIPCKIVSVEGFSNDCELIVIEFSIKTRNWLCIGFYKPPSQNDKYFLDNLSLILNKLTCQFDNITLMGDFNFTVESKNLTVESKNTVSVSTFDTTCFQSAQPNCIDLILTNKKNFSKTQMFQRFEYLIIITASKSQLIKGNAKMK